MGSPEKVHRFRINPVEAVIFVAVAMVFASSVYHLFNEQAVPMTALTPMAANPISEGRQVASSTQAFLSLNVICDETKETTTSASKVRLSGELCGSGKAKDGPKLLKAQVVNQSSKDAATVFSDTENHKFSTDYIHLIAGRNAIHIEFTYKDGKSAAQDIVIMKN